MSPDHDGPATDAESESKDHPLEGGQTDAVDRTQESAGEPLAPNDSGSSDAERNRSKSSPATVAYDAR